MHRKTFSKGKRHKDMLYLKSLRQLMILKSTAKLHSTNLVVCLNLVNTKAVYC